MKYTILTLVLYFASIGYVVVTYTTECANPIAPHVVH